MANLDATMTEQRLQELVDAYGADAQRWPEAERQPALTLLAHKPHLQGVCTEAQSLDEWLDIAPPPLPDSALIGRLLLDVPAPRESLFRRLWPFERVWQPTVALAASIMFGVLVGMQIPDEISPSEPLVAESENMEAWRLLAYGPEQLPEW
ncbi:hypothetical protein [Magnetococcus sp. PR-3]|uniref:hypothetical protein n=1 Tax=Magnetococcus sp. PR-3 TaxID=3120355 RepID=UPI002FCE3FA3